MSNFVAIIQARMNSCRLPGKSMMPIAEHPMIECIVRRLMNSKLICEIVIATSDLPADDDIADLGLYLGIRVVRGPERDVLARYKKAARLSNADVIVRIPGDNPLVDPQEIDRLIEYSRARGDSFGTNLSPALGSGYADGFGGEIFSRVVLEGVCRKGRGQGSLEHVHLNFFDYVTGERNSEFLGEVWSPVCPIELQRPTLRFDVNTIDDLLFVRSIYRAFENDLYISAGDVINWYDNAFGEQASNQ